MSYDARAERDRRWQRLQEMEGQIMATQDTIIQLVRLTVGRDEMPEYEHVGIDRRYAEMSAFYYWWICNLIFNSTDYEWKTDYAQAIADILVQRLLGSGFSLVLQERWVEYERDFDTSVSMKEKAATAARSVLQHMDPTIPVSNELARTLAENGTQMATALFRANTSWR